MSRQLLSYDPLTATKVYFHYDEMTDTAGIETLQDVSAVLEDNKALQNMDGEPWRGADNDMWLAANIPLRTQEEWLVKFGIDVFNRDHWPGVKRLLNSNEYRHLRVGLFAI